MSTLHIINNTGSALDSCLRLIQKNSAILLIEDGVLAVIKNSESSEKLIPPIANQKVYVLEPDLKARGITQIIDGVEKVDYDNFVKLTVEYNGVQSWT